MTACAGGSLAVASTVDSRSGPSGDVVRVAFGLSYEGTGFHGFAVQPRPDTVAGAFLEALSRITGEEHRYVCAGRTDAGVHASGQVVHVDLALSLLARRYHVDGTELPELARALTRQLAPKIVVWRARIAAPGFDARHSALARRYRYDVGVGEHPDPLRANASWWVGPGLDLSVLRIACDPLIGSHDFAAFCRRPPGHEGPLTRRVLSATWSVVDEELWRFEIESSSFCHQMVRSIVGWHVAIAKGRHRPSELTERLRAPRRSASPVLAPPVGLCLVSVTYPEAFGGVWSKGAV